MEAKSCPRAMSCLYIPIPSFTTSASAGLLPPLQVACKGGFVPIQHGTLLSQVTDPCYLYVNQVNTSENFNSICQHPMIKDD